jgi:hypothetical protein
MSFYLPGPPLIAALVTATVGLLSWGFWRYRKNRQSSAHIEWLDMILIGFAALSVVTLLILWISLSFRVIP